MNFKKVLILIIILSLISTSILVMNRINTERKADKMEFVISYQDLVEMSKQSDKDIKFWLEKFKEFGVRKVALKEMNLEYFIENDYNIEALMIKELKEKYNWRNRFDNEIVDYLESDNVNDHDVIIQIGDKEFYDSLSLSISNNYDKDFYKFLSSKENNVIILDGRVEDSYYQVSNVLIDNEGENVKKQERLASSKLFEIGFGFDQDAIELIKQSGLEVNLRPYNFPRYGRQKFENYISFIKQNDLMPEYIIFDGKSILGYDEAKNDLYKFLKKNDIQVTLIENIDQLSNIEQKGIFELTEKLDYNAVRLFSIIDYIQQRFGYYNYEGPEEIENTVIRAVTERNIRLIYFKPFKVDEKRYVTDVNEYDKFFKNVEERLKRYDIEIDKPKSFNYNNPNIYMILMSAFGVLALFILLIMDVFKLNNKINILLFVLGILAIAVLGILSKKILTVLIAFAAVIVFSSFSINVFINNLMDISLKNDSSNDSFTYNILGNIILVVSTLLICLMGGFYVAGFLSHTEFLLEISFFRGVKLSLLLPLILLAIIYIIKFGYKRDLDQEIYDKKYYSDLFKFLDDSIKIKYIIALVFVAVLGFVYIARTGNEIELPILEYELIFRNYLERLLIARPRTKEFLIAFPSLMVAVYFAQKKVKPFVFPFFILGSIGFTSILNTFSHSRTPIYMSFYRTITSISFGIILGVIGIFIIDLIFKYYNRRFTDE